MSQVQELPLVSESQPTMVPPVGDNPDDSSLMPPSSEAMTEGPSGLGLNSSMSTQDAMQALTHRNRPHKIWRKRYAKLMVVGDAGLGKTTLIRTLLSVHGQKIQLHDGTETSIDQFRKNPNSLCFQICWRDEEDRVEWYYTVQDTPGYGDNLDIHRNIETMVNFVTKQNTKWFGLETSKKRPANMTLVEDPRIDVCLFCLPPHRLRYIDVKFMFELGKVVPIIPVITKADTMNIQEATVYRQEVHSKLQNMGQFGLRGKIQLFEFQKETLARAGVDASISQFQTMPFLVVASNEVNMDLNQKHIFWPERQYAWGTCEAFNPEHSDVLQLRLLLLKEGLEEISAAKLERYELWRRRRLSKLRFGLHLRALVLTATAVVAFSFGGTLANHRSIGKVIREALKGVLDHVNFIKRVRSRCHKQETSLNPMTPVPRRKRALFG
eukprot:g8386.t1